MILPNPKDAVHKAWLYRTLINIVDNKNLAQKLCFKGGTCAAMQGFLDRFSIDLDFDYIGDKHDLKETSTQLEEIFKKLGLEIKDKSQNVPQYFLKYPARENERNTLKIDITFPSPKNNQYELVRLVEIDRIVKCQTKETMFANKLVALIERYEKNTAIAGRDLYDIHYFFMNGYKYDTAIILERRKEKSIKLFLKKLIKFIENHITETILNQDLNVLLPLHKFKNIKKELKHEVIMFLKDEKNKLA